MENYTNASSLGKSGFYEAVSSFNRTERPHLYREWAIRKNRRTEETEKWFGENACVYTSTHDLISRILQFDCDGDTSLVINDKLLVSIAKRNMENIVPLAYELKKAQPQLLSNEAMYEGMVAAYKGGSIGPLSNDITKVWNSGQIGQEQLNVVKWLTYIVNQNIDYSKTLWKVDPPEEVKELIRSYTKSKTPDFFIYAKDKSKNQVEQPNNSVMNRIGAKIPNSKIHFSTRVGKFDYRLLMNPDIEFELYPESNIIKSYDFWNARANKFIVDKSMKNQDFYKYRCLREKVIEETGKDIYFIVNTLVFYLYTVRKTSAKKGLWDGFGDILLENLKSNVGKLGNICPVCGNRFDPANSLHTVCSDECRVKYNKLYMMQYRTDVKFCKRDENPQTVAAQGIEQKYSKKNETNRESDFYGSENPSDDSK